MYNKKVMFHYVDHTFFVFIHLCVRVLNYSVVSDSLQPTPVFLPGKFQGQWSLMGYRSWGCKESDTTE